ncbi:hypothetical protein [Amycolatopsis pittospori]|uniref:hypothetical protein n=1 Tax=Amycolatopsis pittospori TaxID=2749434 RepID=UPI0015F0C19C|nr:hypothetical protein [Amycolatopsis pittospori]
MTASDIMGLAGLVLSIIGIPLAFVLARRGRKRPLLKYSADFKVLASSKHGAFETGFMRAPSGEPIVTISRTTVAIWNHQGDTLRGVDIVPQDRLRIKLSDGDYPLQVRIAARSRVQNELSVKVDPQDRSAVLVEFDFLDSGDGGLVEVIHQGSEVPALTGTIRGASIDKRPPLNLSPDLMDLMRRPWYRRIRRRITLQVLILAIAGVSSAIVFSVMALSLKRDSPELVDYVRFDLNTLEGQEEFGREVASKGLSLIQIPNSIIVAIAMVVILLYGYPLFRRLRLKIPRSIIRIVDEKASDVDSSEASVVD